MSVTLAQKAQILDHLQIQPITARQAYKHYGCLRLAARIHDLREDGLVIETEWVKPRRGNRYAQYQLSSRC